MGKLDAGTPEPRIDRTWQPEEIKEVIANMKPALSGPLDILAIFLGIVLLLEVGRRLGRRQFATKPELARTVDGTVDGAVFGLISLLIAFTFSGAALRFETRRSLIVQEANDIRTA